MMADNNQIAFTDPDFRNQLQDALHAGANRLVVDLADVETLDSTSIGLIIAAFNSVSKVGGTLELVNTSPVLIGLFKALRLDKQFNISATSMRGQ